MRYNLGDFRYDNGRIYKRIWWFIYLCVNKGPYSHKEGVRKVNELCEIFER